MTRSFARRRAALALAAACAGPIPGAGAQELPFHRHREVAVETRAAPGKTFPFDVTWSLQSVDGKPAPARDPPTLAVDQTLRASGFAGCNTFSMAFYPIKNQTLAAGAIATTRKICGPDVMAAERTLLVTLHSLPHWDLTPEGDLVLKTARTEMRFRRGL